MGLQGLDGIDSNEMLTIGQQRWGWLDHGLEEILSHFYDDAEMRLGEVVVNPLSSKFFFPDLEAAERALVDGHACLHVESQLLWWREWACISAGHYLPARHLQYECNVAAKGQRRPVPPLVGGGLLVREPLGVYGHGSPGEHLVDPVQHFSGGAASRGLRGDLCYLLRRGPLHIEATHNDHTNRPIYKCVYVLQGAYCSTVLLSTSPIKYTV